MRERFDLTPHSKIGVHGVSHYLNHLDFVFPHCLKQTWGFYAWVYPGINNSKVISVYEDAFTWTAPYICNMPRDNASEFHTTLVAPRTDYLHKTDIDVITWLSFPFKRRNKLETLF